MSVFKADDYAFCSSLLLESNDRVCIAHLIHIFKNHSDDVEIINVVNHSIIPLLLNIIEISEDNQINYIIYFFDYLCSFVNPGVNNNNLFIIIKKYFQIIKNNYKFYLFTYFNIKNVVYLFKKYFPNSSDLIGQLRLDFDEKYPVISISLNKKYRGLGLSKVLLAKGLELVDGKVVAYIKKENWRSISFFKSMGFKKDDDVIIKNCDALKFIKE
jgi:hypothetical protein